MSEIQSLYTDNITTRNAGSLNLNIDFDELACEIHTNVEENFDFLLVPGQAKSGVTSIRKTAKSGYTEANVQQLDFRKFREMRMLEDIESIYTWKRKLGEGQFGTVYEAVHKKAQLPCAIKTVKKAKLEERLDDTLVELMMQELEALDLLEHPNIVRVLDLCEDRLHIYIVLELMVCGTLTDMLTKIMKINQHKKQPAFTEADASNIVKQLLLAINFLHGRNICHRDLKLDNIMVEIERNERDNTASLVCKITDFGFAKAIDPQQKESMSLGTPLYMAPELAKNEEYGLQVDIWALGVITHNIMVGKPPFIGRDRHETFDRICNSELDLTLFNKFKDNGTNIKDFIQCCLSKDPEARSTATELLTHPWIQENHSKQEVISDTQIDIGLSLYTFKRSSVFQSSVISFMTRLKPDQEEIAQLRKIYQQLDTNQDGVLQLSELEAGMDLFKTWFRNNQGKEPDWQKLVECIDMNNDGQVEWDEFMTAATNRYRLIMDEENLRTAFDILDKDGNGQITLEELQECFQMSNLDEHVGQGEGANLWKKMMTEIDKNGDGIIDFEEFKTHMQGLVDKGNFNLRPQLKKLGTAEQVHARIVAVDAQNSDIDSDDQRSLS